MRTMVVTLTGECPRCGKGLRVRQRGFDGGHFVGCSGSPQCRFKGDYDVKLKNPCGVTDIPSAVRRELRALTDQFDLT